MILRRLAVFVGAFGLRGASTVVASAELASAELVDGLANLGREIAGRGGCRRQRYALLLARHDRAYALEKLGEAGERERLARRHAEYYRDLFERAETEGETRPTAEWLVDYGLRIDNLRAALDWAFSPGVEASIAVALTTAAAPLWTQLSLQEARRGRVERALAALQAEASRDARHEMKLRAALGGSLIYARNPTDPDTGAARATALEIAEDLDEAEYRLRSLW